MSNNITEDYSTPPINGTDWDVWLSKYDEEVKKHGYRKFNQGHKREDFSYYKVFYDNDKNKIYQVGVLMYDFRQYAERDPNANRIGIQYECMLLCDDRIDLSVSKHISLSEFEEMAKTFYDSMIRYCH